MVPLDSAIGAWKRRLSEWRGMQKTYMPLLAAYIEDEQVTLPDEEGNNIICDSQRMTDLDGDWEGLSPTLTPSSSATMLTLSSSSSCTPNQTAVPAPTPSSVPLDSRPMSAIRSQLNPDVHRGRIRTELLGLPSDCNANELEELELSSLAAVEYTLRISRAFILLKAVRKAVKHVSAYVKVKKNTRGAKRHNTRTQTEIYCSRALATRLTQRFNDNMRSILRLRSLLNITPAPTSMEAKLRPIRQEDIVIGNLVTPAPHGERQQSSWIWGVFEHPSELRRQPARTASKAKATADHSAPTSSWEDNGECPVVTADVSS